MLPEAPLEAAEIHLWRGYLIKVKQTAARKEEIGRGVKWTSRHMMERMVGSLASRPPAINLSPRL